MISRYNKYLNRKVIRAINHVIMGQKSSEKWEFLKSSDITPELLFLIKAMDFCDI